jgi:hypothetical protein
MENCRKRKRKYVPFARKDHIQKIEENIIYVEYSSDYDIIFLHKIITETLSNNNKELDDLNEKINKIDEILKTKNSISEIRKAEIERKKLILKKENIYNNTALSKYNNASRDYIQAYASIPETNRPIDRLSSESIDLNEIEIKREKIVDSYLAIAKSYAQITIKKNKTEKNINRCGLCGKLLCESNLSISGFIACSNINCGSDNYFGKTAINSQKEYDPWGNFLKAHKRYNGTAPIKFNIITLMEDLDSYFLDIGDMPGEYYRLCPSNENGRKNGTSHENICKALKCLGYNSFYKNYMYICHEYYGWELPNLIGKEILLEKNFREKQKYWNQMSFDEKEGKSSLATEYRLCREYQHIGYKCELSDFKISIKEKTLLKYDKIYSRMCFMAGYKFPHI